MIMSESAPAQPRLGEGGGEEGSRAHFNVRERAPGAANARRGRISGCERKGGENHVLLNHYQLEEIQQRRRRELAERICAKRLQVESVSIRRVIGRSIMSIGARLAAEPQPQLARSR